MSDLLSRADVTRAMLCRLLRGQPTVDHHSIQTAANLKIPWIPSAELLGTCQTDGATIRFATSGAN